MAFETLAVAAGLLAACLAGCLAAVLRAGREEQRRLRTRLAATQAEAAQFGALNAQISSLRHDIRGILSPAMLVADRLLDNPDPGVRRAGEMVIRTVERTTARLAETRLNQEGLNQEGLDQETPKAEAG